jgi:hypothetical protein
LGIIKPANSLRVPSIITALLMLQLYGTAIQLYGTAIQLYGTAIQLYGTAIQLYGTAISWIEPRPPRGHLWPAALPEEPRQQ